MYVATILLAFVLVVLLIVSAVYRSRSQKRTGKALAGLERSQRELGELSDEVGEAASENADLVARLEVAMATGGGDVRGFNFYVVGAACLHCGNVRQFVPASTQEVGAGIASSVVAARRWHIESHGYPSLLDFHTGERRLGAAVWERVPSEADDDGESWTSSTWLDRSGAYPDVREEHWTEAYP